MVKCYKKNYPRPQLVRDNWTDLNGSWDFRFDDENRGEKDRWYEAFCADQTIQVPFVYTTKLSGINEQERHDFVWYGRQLEADGEMLRGNRLLLHFEGSDFFTKVWVNGRFAGSHRGGYARFSFDITDLLQDGTNQLVVKVEDSMDAQQPRGKQRWSEESFACWYVETTGIWKAVWAEYVPCVSIGAVKMTPDMTHDTLELEYSIHGVGSCERTSESLQAEFENLTAEAEISLNGVLVSRTRTEITSAVQCASANVLYNGRNGMQWGTSMWTPKNPVLYDVTFRLLSGDRVIDEVGSYFAMREIRIEGNQVMLNGSPLYQRLILDQGYWKDSHLTPPNEEALIEDIDKIHALGYNGLRKHQKIEDERFLFWCDVKGMLVWSEMAAAYRFSDYALHEFAEEWMEIVRQNYNHPCIITWTPFNESWGVRRIRRHRAQQYFTEAIYNLTKSFDPYRPVIVNDGWEHTVSDIITLHDYEAKGENLKRRYVEQGDKILYENHSHNGEFKPFADGYSYKGQPVIISEYGGIALNNDDAGWGYGDKMNSEEEFLGRFDDITTAVKEIPYVCGYCYTQVTDVQQEINGLMDMDRRFKIDPKKIAAINVRKDGAMNNYKCSEMDPELKEI